MSASYVYCVRCTNVVLLFQTEKAYQKQRLTFQNSKAVLIGGSKKKKGLRFVRNVGLGFKTPREVSCFKLNGSSVQ